MSNRKDKNSIINQIVSNAADVMEAKAEEEEMIADLFEGKGDHERASKLRDRIKCTTEAVALMRANAGCWT